MFKIAMYNLKRHKKSTVLTSIGFIVIATSIFLLIFLLLSYQRYRENAQREEQNWEAKYSYLPKEEINTIQHNENVKEISIAKENGTMEYITQANITIIEELKLVSYDQNAMKNMKLKVKEGRLPQNEDEIVISLVGGTQIYFGQKEYQIGDTILFETENFSKEYTIVGTVYSTMYDESYMYHYTIGAITYLNSIEENANYDVYVLYKNPSKIYETNEKMMTDIGENVEITYNEELLNYMLVTEKGSSFEKMLYTIGGIVLAIMLIVSFILIFTIYSILLSNRRKEFGTLRSIGASKKQIKKLIFSETVMLNSINIPVSLLISIGIVYMILHLWNGSIAQLTGADLGNFIVDTTTQFSLVISVPLTIVGIILIFLITILSVWIPINHISKISPMEVIKEYSYLDIKKEQKHKNKWCLRLLGEEGYIAYQYISKNKGKSISIMLAIMVSVMLFIIVSNYITNIYAQIPNDNREYNYLTYANNLEEYENKIADLRDKSLIESNYTKEILEGDLSLRIEKNDIHTELAEFIQANLVPHAFDNPYGGSLPQLDCNIFTIVENREYENLLKEFNISELKEGECIILNQISFPQVADFHLTNFKDGDEIQLFNVQYSQEARENAPDLFGKKNDTNTYQYEALKDISLKAVKVVDSLGKFANYSDFNNLYNNPVQILVSTDTFNKLKDTLQEQYRAYDKEGNLEVNTNFEMYINTNNPYALDDYLKNSNHGIGAGINYQQEIDSTNNSRLIMGIVLYSFIILIAIACILNIFCILYFNIQSRSKDFAVLKSLGMDKKQIDKMLNIECLIYSGLSLIVGMILGIGIHKIIYDIQYELNNHFMYAFHISITSILICIVFVIAVVGICMKIAKGKIKYENLTEMIKRESV